VVHVEFSPRHVFYGLGVLLLAYLLYVVRSTVVLVGIAVMLMAALHPLVQLATRRGLSHGAAVAVVMLSLVPLAMVVALSPLIISEVQGFAHNVPTLQQHIDDLLRHAGLASQVNSAIINLARERHREEGDAGCWSRGAQPLRVRVGAAMHEVMRRAVRSALHRCGCP
jgi:predicted PurR-regulated permease PerM